MRVSKLLINAPKNFIFALHLQHKNIKCKFQNFKIGPLRPFTNYCPQLTKIAPRGVVPPTLGNHNLEFGSMCIDNQCCRFCTEN